MAKEINKLDKSYFECEECNFVYKDERIAEKCEDYCKKHHACNIDITKYSIKI